MSKQISKRWKMDVRGLVSEYSFSEVVVFDSSHRESIDEANTIYSKKFNSDLNISRTCDFCGSHLRYVAIIEGTNTNTSGVVKTVGCDCLEIVLGKTHILSKTVRRRVRDLAKRARLRKQREKNLETFKIELPILESISNSKHGSYDLKKAYSAITKGANISEKWESYIKTRVSELQLNFVTYKDEISGLEKIIKRDPTKHSSGFISDMYQALLNGRAITDNMLNSIRGIIERDNPNVREKMEKELREIINPKLDELIKLIEYVDGDRITYYPQFSSYDFIVSVKNRVNDTKQISQKQIDAIERTFVRYSKSAENKKKKLEREKKKREKQLEQVS